MYTGIVQDTFKIVKLDKKPGLHTLTLEFTSELLDGLKIGSSVGLDGVCFTVVSIEGNLVKFDAMQETLDKTTIGLRNQGDLINIERSAKAGDEIGGHILSGHVHDTASIINMEESENNLVISFKISEKWSKYIFTKGFLAINGCSLTVADMDKESGVFKVFFIPETLRKTTFGVLKLGDKVNIEIDGQTQIIVDTIENILGDRMKQFFGN